MKTSFNLCRYQTEKAEQTFSVLRKYKGVMRQMGMLHALFFLSIMVEHMNHDTHCRLMTDGKEPLGANEAAFAAKNRKQSKEMSMHVAGFNANEWVDND